MSLSSVFKKLSCCGYRQIHSVINKICFAVETVHYFLSITRRPIFHLKFRKRKVILHVERRRSTTHARPIQLEQNGEKSKED